MTDRPLLIVILAAGKGTRMKSALPKVLHPIAGRPMLGHVMDLAEQAGAQRLAVVVGPGQADVRQLVTATTPGAALHEQASQLGTADAVKAARASLAAHAGDVLVLFADTPLFRVETIIAVRKALAAGADVAVVAFEAADPTGYGRVVTDAEGRPTAIREEKDASAAERIIRLCNAGVMGFRGQHLPALLDAVKAENAKGEYYLTDTIALARGRGLATALLTCPEEDVLGVNARDQLAAAEAIWQRRARFAAMQGGVTMTAPETVWLSHDTRLGRDVTIEPNVFFGPGVTVEDDVEILANCHFERAVIRKGARVGPFARLRPGADLGPDVHVGNFVEVKNVVMEAGAKANHLTYLGDGRVGPKANIGAGTIFCNYDGFAKHKTEIGAGAFVGSNTSLVAPVKVGDGAYIGSGSVITKNVPAGALALERAEMEVREGWATKFRTMMARRKKA